MNLRPQREMYKLSISSLQMTILRLNISMLCCDDTVRWDLLIIVRDTHVTWCYDSCCTRSFENHPMTGFISMYRSPKRSYFERMVLYFSRYLLVDPKNLFLNGAKKLSNLNISWWVKYYGNSTKHSWNVCCTRLHRLVLRPIVLSA